MIKLSRALALLGVVAVFTLAVTSVQAATPAEEIQPASATKVGDVGRYLDEYNSYMQLSTSLHSSATMHLPSVHIGSVEPGAGGVTFFNGTIRNAAKDGNGGDTIPVTFGDDVRIDGAIWRGPSKGTSDDQPLKIADSVIPALNSINDFGTSELAWRDGHFSRYLYAGEVVASGDVQAGYDLIAGNDGDIGASLNVTDNITVGGTVDGVDVSEENAVWYGDNTNSVSQPSKIITGVFDRSTGEDYGTATTVNFPSGIFTNVNSYTVTATYELANPSNSPDSFYPIAINRVDADTFEVYALHSVDGLAGNYAVMWQAIGF